MYILYVLCGLVDSEYIHSGEQLITIVANVVEGMSGIRSYSHCTLERLEMANQYITHAILYLSIHTG